MHVRVTIPTLFAPVNRGKVLSALYCLIILISQTAQAQEELQILLPPVAADHSLSVAKIRAALNAKDFLKGQAASDKLIELAPNDFEGYFWRAALQFQQHNYGDAILSLRRAQSLEANIHVLKLLGLSYYFLGQFRLFVKTMLEAMERDPKDFAPYYYVGRYFASADAGDFPKAVSYFQDALKRKPDHYQSHFYLGYCDEAQQNWPDAEQEYLRSIVLAEATGHRFAPPNQGMARLKLHAMKPLEALPFARTATSIDPGDPIGHEVLARTFAELNRRDEAAAEWEREAELDPTNPSPLYRLYRLYLELGRKQQAGQAFDRYKNLVAIYGSS
jgi:tetratricopeptide (TPR) repeat protein